MLPNSIVLSRTAEVVVTATGGRRPSVNKKTGNMIQIQAAPSAVDPVTAGQTGHQKLVCFDCPIQALCYVNRGHAPLAVWQATKAQPPIDLSVWDGWAGDKPVRLGSWGDPAAMPTDVLETVTAGLHTGYTHQWRQRSDLSEICMASVETPDQREIAAGLGWRTFRPILEGESPDTGEILCPYVSHGVQCADCLLCSGRRSQAKDIVVPIHGTYQTAGKAYLQAL